MRRALWPAGMPVLLEEEQPETLEALRREMDRKYYAVVLVMPGELPVLVEEQHLEALRHHVDQQMQELCP